MTRGVVNAAIRKAIRAGVMRRDKGMARNSNWLEDDNDNVDEGDEKKKTDQGGGDGEKAGKHAVGIKIDLG